MTTTATTTRHAARCDCGSFCATGQAMCRSCTEAYRAGYDYREASVQTLTAERDAARQAAVADHAAHVEAMEAQERKADAVIAELRIQRDEQCKMANDYRAELVAKDRLLDQAREARDRAISERNMAEQSDDVMRVAAQQAAAQAIAQRDQAVYDAERLARWLGYAIAAAITGALAAVAGWVL